jgi:hypothetical protein
MPADEGRYAVPLSATSCIANTTELDALLILMFDLRVCRGYVRGTFKAPHATGAIAVEDRRGPTLEAGDKGARHEAGAIRVTRSTTREHGLAVVASGRRA